MSACVVVCCSNNQIAALGYVSYTNQIASDRLCMYNRSDHSPEAPRVPVFELSLFFNI